MRYVREISQALAEIVFSRKRARPINADSQINRFLNATSMGRKFARDARSQIELVGLGSRVSAAKRRKRVF